MHLYRRVGLLLCIGFVKSIKTGYMPGEGVYPVLVAPQYNW